MRDSQRGRLYTAERTVAAFAARPFGTLVETWAYLERVERDRWFKRHYGIKHFRLHDGGGRRAAGAVKGGTWISLPRWSRFPLVILHEVAHTVTPSNTAAHGREYAAIYLTLVRHFMGEAAHAELRAAFKAHKVRYTPARQISPGQRVAMVARLAAARGRPSARFEPAREPDHGGDHRDHLPRGLGYHPE